MAKKQKTRKDKIEANMRVKHTITPGVSLALRPYSHVYQDLKKTLFLTLFILALQLGLFFVLR